MEQRALELSQKLSEMSGTEPIELIDRNESLDPVLYESPAQLSYDQLPGPYVEPLPTPVEEKTVEPVSTVYQSEVTHVVATSQQRKGDYYLMPILGFCIQSRLSYDFTFEGNKFGDDLEGSWGNAVGVDVGRRWDNWLAFLRLSYQYQELSNPRFKSEIDQVFVSANSIEESFSFSLGGGYAIPLSEKFSTFGTTSIGCAFRKNSFDFDVFYTPPLTLIDSDSNSESSLVFTYDFSIGLEYMFSHNYSARLGYRMLGLTSNKSFDSSFQHLIELGVGANF